MNYQELELHIDGTIIKLKVSATPLYDDVNNIYTPVSFNDTLAYCRNHNALPLTEKLSDTIYLQAQQILPKPQLVTDMRLAALQKYASNVTNQINTNALIADCGKDWLLDNAITSSKAVNYGWHITSTITLWRGIKLFKTKLQGVMVVQPKSTMHNWSHKDYSQVLRVVDRKAIVNGAEVELKDILLNTDLLSYERIGKPVFDLCKL